MNMWRGEQRVVTAVKGKWKLWLARTGLSCKEWQVLVQCGWFWGKPRKDSLGLVDRYMCMAIWGVQVSGNCGLEICGSNKMLVWSPIEHHVLLLRLVWLCLQLHMKLWRVWLTSKCTLWLARTGLLIWEQQGRHSCTTGHSSICTAACRGVLVCGDCRKTWVEVETNQSWFVRIQLVETKCLYTP